MEKYEKLIEALKAIHDECAEHRNDKCKDCSLYSETLGACLITDEQPINWFIYDEPKAIIKVME